MTIDITADVTETTDAAPRMTHEQAEKRLRDIADEMDRLAKRDTLDEIDQKRWDDLKTEGERVGAYKLDLERKADLAKIRAAAFGDGVASPRVRVDQAVSFVHNADNSYDRDPFADVRSAEDLKRRNPWDMSNFRSFGRGTAAQAAEFRARALDAVAKMPGASDTVRQGGTKIVEQWDDADGRLSRFVLASSSPAYMRAFVKAATGRQMQQTREEQEAVADVEAAYRAMSLTDNAGGFLTPYQLDPTVIITSAGSFNPVRQVARQMVATTDVVNLVSSTQVSFSFKAEATELSDNATTYANPQIAIQTASALVPISIQAYMDLENVTAQVARQLAFGKDTLESQKFITGAAASNEPVGVQAIVSASANASTCRVASKTTDTFAYADLYTVKSSLPARYRQSPNCAWLANDAFWSLTRTGAGSAPSDWTDPSGDVPPRFLGKQVLEAEAMISSVTATADNFAVIIGDFNEYVIADRIGLTVEFVPHLTGTANNYPSLQRGWAAYFRVGANITHPGAFRVYNIT